MFNSPARDISMAQSRRIIQKLNSNIKLKEDLYAFVQSAHAHMCTSASEIRSAFDDFFHMKGSFRTQDGITFRIPVELRAEINHVISECVKSLGTQFGHEQDIEQAIWKTTASYITNSDNQPSDLYKSFVSSLLNPNSSLINVLLPNRLLSFAEGFDEFSIGPVKALAGHKAIDYLYQHKASNNWSIHSGDDLGFGSSFSPTGEGKINLGVPRHCWFVEVASAKSYAVKEAIWLIDIAVSLINLTMFDLLGPHTAKLGQCDSHPLRVDPKDFFIVSDQDGILSGFSKTTGHYILGKEAMSFSQQPEFRKMAEDVFFPKSKSVGEHLARGLGWLSRARRRNDNAERFLLCCTAIESVLSSPNTDASIVQNISRFIGCIMTDDPRHRLKWSQDVRLLYGLRSKLVHHGVRDISMTNMKKVENLAELLCIQIINKVELQQDFDKFLAELVEVSYGLPWLDGRKGWLEG